MSDAEWLRDLHSVGLLRASFRPTAAIVTLRTYMRHRHTSVELAAMHIQRMQKALVQMNLQLPVRDQRHHRADRPADHPRHCRRGTRPDAAGRGFATAGVGRRPPRSRRR